MRVFGAEGYDDAGEGEVDPCCQKGRGDGQADDLHQETVLWVRISMDGGRLYPVTVD